jgi:hypothetical protein
MTSHQPDAAATTDGRPSLTDLSLAANALSGGGNLEEAAERLAVTVGLYLLRQQALTGPPRIEIPGNEWPMRDWPDEEVTVGGVVMAVEGGNDDDDLVTVTHSGNGRPLRIGGVRVVGDHVDIVIDEVDGAGTDAPPTADSGRVETLERRIAAALTAFRTGQS